MENYQLSDMYLKEIIAEIEAGNMKVESVERGTRTRHLAVRSKDKGDWYTRGWQGKDGQWHEKEVFEGEILRYEKKTYPKYLYLAVVNADGSTYRINKTIYQKYKAK